MKSTPCRRQISIMIGKNSGGGVTKPPSLSTGSAITAATSSEATTLLNVSSRFFFSSRRRHTRFDCDWSSDRVLFRSTPATAQHDVLVSNQRFVLEMFPAFITLAMLGVKYPRLHLGLLITFPFLQATLAMLFVLNRDRKSTRLNSSHSQISYAVFCLKK